MPFARPTLQEIINRIISDFNNRVSGSMTFLRRSFFKIIAYAFGGQLHLLYEFLNYIKDQLFISTSDIENLERHGAEYSLLRDQGTQATGSALAYGTAGTVIVAGSEVQSADKLKYRITTTATVGAGGTVTVNLLAEEVGTDYNQVAGTLLSFVSPISFIQGNIVVDSNAITGGEDEETDAEYRTRLLFRKRYPPHGGVDYDYEKWALEYPGVTRAWAIPEYYGIGTIGLVFVMDGQTSIFPTSTQRTAVKNYLISHIDTTLGKTVGIPVTAQPGFFVIEATALTVNMTIGIYPYTTAMQTAITTKLTELIREKGGAEQTIYISDIYEAVKSVTGLSHCEITYPTTDVTAAVNQVHILGTITYGLYT